MAQAGPAARLVIAALNSHEISIDRALYDVLVQRGFRVFVVNARDTKNLPGRKIDVQESQC